MNKNKLIILFITTIFFALSIFAYSKTTEKNDILEEVSFSVGNEENLKLYKEDGKLYLFVPSGADLDKVTISCPNDKVYISDNKINSGVSITDMALDKGITYNLSYKKKQYEFIVLQSDNVPTLFISNATEDFQEVLDDKDHKEPVELRLKDKDGNHIYRDFGTISGRGNSTWKLAKKPFNLYLENSVSLLGLGVSNKYCLLANGFDESNIRNKLIYDFAKEIDPNWTPGCEYVDLYINGEYHGLYLLSESVQIEEEKINISLENGYWFSMSIPSRISYLDQYVVTDDNRIVEVKYPKKSDQSILLDHLNVLEDGLKSKDYENMIDMDSWVRKFLIDEIFGNSDLCSMYFYWDSSDGTNKIYAGPHWDYDNALGNAACNRIKQPATALFAKQDSRLDGYGNSWFVELYNEELFADQFRDIYKNEYRSILEDIITNRIDDLSSSIETASYCNSVRWNTMFDGYVYNDTSDEIKQYLTDRVSFLDSLWIDGDRWYTVRIDRGAKLSYMLYSVKEGEKIDSLPDEKSLDSKEVDYYIDAKTGEKFSGTESIYEDRYLKAVFVEDNNENGGVYWSKTVLACIAACILFVGILIYLSIIDWRRHIGQQI